MVNTMCLLAAIFNLIPVLFVFSSLSLLLVQPLFSPKQKGLVFSPGKRERDGLDGWHADLSWGPADQMPVDWMGGTRIGAGGSRGCGCCVPTQRVPVPDTGTAGPSAGPKQRAPATQRGLGTARERRGPTQKAPRPDTKSAGERQQSAGARHRARGPDTESAGPDTESGGRAPGPDIDPYTESPRERWPPEPDTEKRGQSPIQIPTQRTRERRAPTQTAPGPDTESAGPRH